jgi:hypothetical protein
MNQIMDANRDLFFQTVGKISVIDSWVIPKDNLNEGQQEFYRNNVSHYQASVEPMGQLKGSGGLSQDLLTCPHRSSGHP